VGVRHALFPGHRHWAPHGPPTPRRCSPRQAELSGLAAGPSAGLRPTDYRVRPLCPLRSRGCATGLRTRYRHTGLCSARLYRFSSGLPPLLAVRWPGVTGLTSYLSGCIDMASQRSSLKLRQHSEGLAHCRADPPRCRRSLCHAVRRGFWPGPFDPVGEPPAPCWFAVAAFTLWVTTIRAASKLDGVT
jgi:hypothetical protein